jgi:hypothetical protein
MIRKERAVSLLVATLVLVATLSAPAAASPLADVLGEDEEDDGLLPDVDAIIAGAEGAQERISAWTSRKINGAPSAEAKANETASRFNQNSGAIVEYVNRRATADTDHDVAKITFVLGDEEATRYLVASVNETTGNYTSAELVTPAEYEERGYRSTDLDGEVELSGFATENAPEEVDHFMREFVEPDRDVGGSPHMARMKSRYAGSVEASFEW